MSFNWFVNRQINKAEGKKKVFLVPRGFSDSFILETNRWPKKSIVGIVPSPSLTSNQQHFLVENKILLIQRSALCHFFTTFRLGKRKLLNFGDKL